VLNIIYHFNNYMSIFTDYTNKSVEEVFEELKTSENGLSKKEAGVALEKYGGNEMKVRNINALEILIRQLKSPFAYLLLIAAVISILIGQFADSVAVLVFIFINVVIGFFQEYRAEKAVVLLQKFIPQNVKVLRDGKEEIIVKRSLVPGDIVLLEAGDTVPADLRAVNLVNFLVDESALTGESVPVSKITDALDKSENETYKAKNIVFSGTSVVSGKATAVVVSTGKDTVFGGIVKAISGIRRESTYEKSILYFYKLIMRIVVVTIILIFITNILLKGAGSIVELLLFSVALIVSILPEALPAVVSFALSAGSLKLAKQKVVVKRLSAIEDLGNIEVLCTDKTGTLTENKLSLEEIVSSNKKKCFLYGVLGTDTFNPFDRAIFEKADKDILEDAKKYKIISELPFDSYRMKSAILVENTKKDKYLIVKGAPEFVLRNCKKPAYAKGFGVAREILEDIKKEGQEGKRTLALAYKQINKDSISVADEKGLTFFGYFVFEDPLKKTAKDAVELSKKLGVQIKIITGDSKEVAGYVARKTGLASGDQDIILGDELEKMSKEDFDDACIEKSVFARISPDVKHNIIKSLQKRFEVGFMGDGVNDAPALKTADVGIAVVGATDVARESADVVLLEKNLRVVVNGIKEGRVIFANINKYIKIALANNFGQFYSMAVISLFVNFLPMLPVQILLSNILSDLPLIFIATDAVDVDELRKPKNYELHNVLPLIISLALVGTLFDFIFFTIFYRSSPSAIQTLWFIEGLLTDIVLIFVVRTRGKFWKAKKPSFLLLSSTALAGVIIIALPFLKIGQTWFHFVTPPIIPLLIVFLIIIAYFVLSEFVKLVYFHYWTTKKSVVN